MVHIAVIKRAYIDAILQGRKTIESRLTSTRRAPFGLVTPGDLIYFKQSSGPFRACAIAQSVSEHDNLTPSRTRELLKAHHAQIACDSAYIDCKGAPSSRVRYATFITLACVHEVAAGPAHPPFFGSAWAVLADEAALPEHHNMLRDIKRLSDSPQEAA